MQFELDDWQETARRSFRKYLDAEVAPLVEAPAESSTPGHRVGESVVFEKQR